MKRVLVTGGAGFIGSNLVRHMIHQGFQVLCFDKLTYAGNLTSLADVSSHQNYAFIRGDICLYENVHNSINDFNPHWIMHLAAESHVDRSIDGPQAFVDTNVVGTLNVLRASLEYWRRLPPEESREFRFLHVSTDEVYGSLGPDGYFVETTPYDPHSPYAASKAASDHLARAWYHTYGLPVIVTNCSNNYGPFQFPEKLIPVVILKAIQGHPIPVYGTGNNVRDWLYVLDHCLALQAVLSRGRAGETYNIGGKNELRNIDLVHILCAILDELRPRDDQKSYRTQIKFVEDRPGHDSRYAIDTSKIERLIGWRPTQDNSSGFRSTVCWYLDNPHWWTSIINNKYKLERLGRTQQNPALREYPTL